MIGTDDYFDDIGAHKALWCTAPDSGDLARVAAMAALHPMPMISAVPDDVAMLWAWLEKTPARIFARFYMPARGARDERVVSGLTARINTAFKQGAHGAQIFMRASDLMDFADGMGAVRDDLFFNRTLAVGVDVADVGPFEWGGVFDAVRRLRAGALVIVLARDGGARCDFVGRIYAALNAAADAKCDLHFVLGGAAMRAEQALRLVRAMRPEMAGGVRGFVPAGNGGVS